MRQCTRRSTSAAGAECARSAWRIARLTVAWSRSNASLGEGEKRRAHEPQRTKREPKYTAAKSKHPLGPAASVQDGGFLFHAHEKGHPAATMLRFDARTGTRAISSSPPSWGRGEDASTPGNHPRKHPPKTTPGNRPRKSPPEIAPGNRLLEIIRRESPPGNPPGDHCGRPPTGDQPRLPRPDQEIGRNPKPPKDCRNPRTRRVLICQVFTKTCLIGRLLQGSKLYDRMHLGGDRVGLGLGCSGSPGQDVTPGPIGCATSRASHLASGMTNAVAPVDAAPPVGV